MFRHAAPDILYFCWIKIVAKKTPAQYFLRKGCYQADDCGGLTLALLTCAEILCEQ